MGLNINRFHFRFYGIILERGLMVMVNNVQQVRVLFASAESKGYLCMAMKSEWEVYFDASAPEYDEEIFTKNTEAEVKFLLEELALPPGSAILDMGCGTGRHAVRLAQADYRVTGVDISQAMLDQARAAAQAAGVRVEWVHSDAKLFKPLREYDAAISLCEGALCLLGSGDDPLERDLQVLKNVAAGLKPGGKLIVTVSNACRMIRAVNDEEVLAGRFDITSLTEPIELEVNTPRGKQFVPLHERYYTPPEFTRMLRLAGFKVEHIWGGTAGKWDRKPLVLDEMEMMVIARRANEE
jgi:ubiquinone/menaquinone biosynthesis C-methylase UbiE